jgi:hypothetical protein
MTFLILDNILIMEPDDAGNTAGTVTVNNIAYHVVQDTRGRTTINGEEVGNDFGFLCFNIEVHIMKHQRMTAWQKTQYGFKNFNTIKDHTAVYIVADVDLFVYRADDGTCWRYYTGDDSEVCYHKSPWFAADIQPGAAHFKAWVISTIEVK